MPIPEFLLEILVCPLTKKPLVLDGSRFVSTDAQTRLAYRIEDDIPVMLVDEASELTVEEWTSVMRQHGRADLTA